uniref:Uncharacterized protein n=1 Tax=Mycolicibacterium phage Alyssa1 TaxID=3240801 RepID=A0AB39U1Q5_9CAUD
MAEQVPDVPELPPLDHLPQASMRARLILRQKGGVPADLQADRRYLWGYVHLTRVVDKAIREYNAAREAGRKFGQPTAESYTFEEAATMTPYLLLTCDHLETCIDATHEAVEAAKALRDAGVGTQAPLPDTESVRRLVEIRHAVQHTNHRLIDTGSLRPGRRPFGPDDPYGVSPQKDHLVIGAEDPLTYAALVKLIETLYRTSELIGERATLGALLGSFDLSS